jgi:hypothetical protein
MPAQDLTALVDKIVCSRSGRKIDMPLCLDLCHLATLKPGNAKPCLDRLLHHVNRFDDRRAFFALNVLETLVLNGGFSVRFLVSRREYLNELVKRLPESPGKRKDFVAEYILALLSLWSRSLGEKSVYKTDYSCLVIMAEMLRCKGTPSQECTCVYLYSM